jgi:hypothetical protein
MANQIHKTVKFQITKLSNGIIHNYEGVQTFFNSNSVASESSKNFVDTVLQSQKENETYAVTITVTKIK